MECLRRIEDRGTLETAHRTLQICGQVFRYAVATGRVGRDITPDLRGHSSEVLDQSRLKPSTFICSGAAEQILTIRAPKNIDCIDYRCQQIPSQVRLVKVTTPNGKLYVLMTSLLDHDAYPASDFSAWYHSRRRIEEAFKRLKHRLALENISGLSWLVAQQDFGAKILADNLHPLTVLETENYAPILEGYKINRTYAFSHLKRCLPRWLIVAMPAIEQFVEVLAELVKNLIVTVPNASKPRPKHPKPHRKQAYKSTV